MNTDILSRILILLLPNAAAILGGSALTLIRRTRIARNLERDADVFIRRTNTLLAILMTGFWYVIIMAILTGTVLDEERVLDVSLMYFVVITALLLISILAKTVILQIFLEKITESGANISRAMVGMAVTEIPGLISLGLFLFKLMASKWHESSNL